MKAVYDDYSPDFSIKLTITKSTTYIYKNLLFFSICLFIFTLFLLFIFKFSVRVKDLFPFLFPNIFLILLFFSVILQYFSGKILLKQEIYLRWNFNFFKSILQILLYCIYLFIKYNLLSLLFLIFYMAVIGPLIVGNSFFETRYKLFILANIYIFFLILTFIPTSLAMSIFCNEEISLWRSLKLSKELTKKFLIKVKLLIIYGLSLFYTLLVILTIIIVHKDFFINLSYDELYKFIFEEDPRRNLYRDIATSGGLIIIFYFVPFILNLNICLFSIYDQLFNYSIDDK
ncbi:MAG: hypothetical protein LBR11_13240 [Deltaproteobacteria bacterium]|jgi:hypothetical protein|nr:hypothetical protein [Deltaproteobacteria bacterium]